jgi:hypothetical protein
MSIAKYKVLALWLLGFGTPGQTFPPVQLVVDPVFQKGAPVQVVGIKPAGDNFLASVTVKNTTDRYVQQFDITWTVFRPLNFYRLSMERLARIIGPFDA